MSLEFVYIFAGHYAVGIGPKQIAVLNYLNGEWKFGVENYFSFTSSHLKQIQDKINELNGDDNE